MSGTLSRGAPRSSPYTGTTLPQGQPFWIVDGRAYDFTEWMSLHPGGSVWFQQTQGRDISAMLHTYHREPARLQRVLAKYEIKESGTASRITESNILPKLGVPPFLLAPDFDARTDLPKLNYGDKESLAWLIQFFLTLWFNTFLVVASHDFEESVTEDELAVIPEALRNDWAAQQICLSYDLSVVGNRWIDLFLSAGLSPHRVHHVLPWHGSGFANLASEATVREVCAEVGIAWERPRNLIFERFPAVMKHYLLCPVKPAPRSPAMPPPNMLPGPPPPVNQVLGQRPPAMPPNMLPGQPLVLGQLPPGPPAPLSGQPLPPDSVRVRPRSSVRGELGALFRYALDGFRGVGV